MIEKVNVKVNVNLMHKCYKYCAVLNKALKKIILNQERCHQK